jgi:hypothetical protein
MNKSALRKKIKDAVVEIILEQEIVHYDLKRKTP